MGAVCWMARGGAVACRARGDERGRGMSTAGLQQAIASTRGVLSQVQADQLKASTPCASWTVGDVINHVVGGQAFFAAAMRGEQPAGQPPDFAAGDFLASYDDATGACVAAF